MPQINLNIKVLRATGLACNGKIGRLPNGNVKISLNDDSELKKACRRKVVKRTTSPTQDKSFQFCFDSTDSTVAFELLDEAPEPSISYGVVEKTLYDVLTRNRLDIIFLSCDATLSVQADIESQLTVLYALIEVATSLDKLMEIAESTVELHPYITVAYTAVSSVCKSVKGQLDGDEEIRSLLRAITSLYKFTAPLEAAYGNGQELDGTLVEVIRQILRQTIGCVLFIQEYSGHGFASRSISDISSPAGRKIKEFIDVFAGLGTSLALQNALNPTAMDWSGRTTCHPSTRHEDHRRITEWIVEPPTRSQSKVLWITGPPGVGKSTFATTVAKTYAELGRLGAFVFFDRDVQERSSPLNFVRTLAYELSRFDARIARQVENAVKQSPRIAQAGLDGQFRELVKKPLHCAASDMSERGSLGDDGPVVIVIDALDECGNESNRKQLLELLGRETSQLPLVLRVIIASRPEPDMLVEIHKRPNIDHNEL